MVRKGIVGILVLAGMAALFAPPAGAIGKYRLQGGCYALQAPDGTFINKVGSRYFSQADRTEEASHFRMQATALGRYMLLDTDRQMPRAAAGEIIGTTSSPGPAADFAVSGSGAGNRFRLTSVGDGRGLRVDGRHRVLLGDGAEAQRFRFVGATPCATFPEADTGVSGTPGPSVNADGTVRGFIDDHIHLMAYEFIGGDFHCGRPWSPYGITVAMKECEGDEVPNALANNLLSGYGPFDDRPGGWPDFKNWPAYDALLREGTYWKSIERAWQGGLRIMVNDLVQNQALCEIWPLRRNQCADMDVIRLEYRDTLALQNYIDAQYGGPGRGFFRVVRTPAQARQVIASGRLAIVNGVEVSSLFGCSEYRDQPRCARSNIDQGLDELQRMGIASFFPVHKFDNAIGGTHYDSAVTGLLVGIGQYWTSGEFWKPQKCPAGQTDTDNVPMGIASSDAFLAFFKPAPGSVMIYPEGDRLCNPYGLTDLGRYLIGEMMRRGLIVETDHMSVRARSQVLAMLEREGYPGVISSHSWGDDGSTRRLQALGGLVGPMAGGGGFVEQWQKARAGARPDIRFGLGFASDINGMAVQHAATSDGPLSAGPDVRYPFKSYDGTVTFRRDVLGNRTFDFNRDGIAEYGMYPDWWENLRRTAGPQIVDDMYRGAEAYLQLWERTRAAAAVR